MKEEELIEQVKNGNNIAFAALYDYYWQRVYNFTKLYVTSSDSISEIVQDVFVKFWESRHLLDSNKKLEGFLFIITRNIIFNKARFFPQFADGAVERVFADAVQLARRDFQRHAIDGYAVLTHEQRVAVFKHRHDRRRALVNDDLARRFAPVGAGDLPLFHVQNSAVVDIFFGKGHFAQHVVLGRID